MNVAKCPLLKIKLSSKFEKKLHIQDVLGLTKKYFLLFRNKDKRHISLIIICLATFCYIRLYSCQKKWQIASYLYNIVPVL